MPTPLVDQVIDNCPEDVKDDVLDFIEALSNNFGADEHISRVVLFVGPPGNGKTHTCSSNSAKSHGPLYI